MSEAGVRYRVFSPRGLQGGKEVTVFPTADGHLQERAAGAATPLSVFVEAADAGEVRVRVFTPESEKDPVDSASLAALAWLQGEGRLADFADIHTGDQSTAALICGGEWLLAQGNPDVQSVAFNDEALTALSDLNLALESAAWASTGRPNLLLEVADLQQLQRFQAAASPIAALNRATATTGLVLYSREAPAEPALRRADVSFRAFGPLRGFLEDAASSDMCACLVATLGQQGQWPEDSNVLRAAQLQPGQFGLLTAQFSAPGEAIWIGGRAEQIVDAHTVC